MNLSGLILAGGQSRRAGTDKGLKILQGKAWAGFTQQKLIDLKLQTWVSINTQQQESYQELFDKQELIVDASAIPGPLRGILSAHSKFPKNDWLVLACDMVDMKMETMTHLIKCYEDHTNYDFYVYQNEKFYQPFCGIYTAVGLDKLWKTYKDKEEDNYSLQHVFDTFKTYTVAVAKDDESFKNHNR